jgi:type I restriction enzyme S subunit
MKNNNEITINQIAEFKYGKSLPERDRKGGDIPVYGSGGIGGFHNKSLVQKGIIVGRKGTVGSVRFSEVPFYPIDTVFFIDQVKGKNDLKFFYYFLLTIGLSNFDSDAAVPGLNRNLVHKLKASILNPDTQHRIASILSAYDDLIEVNNQRIKLLEETTRELYKEWFVRMRFSGHKEAKFVKGLPEGWEIVRIDSLYKTSSGGTPSREKSEYYINGIYNWVKTGELNDSFIFETSEKITEIALKKSSAKLFPPYTTIFAMYGNTIGQLGITTQPAATNQACCALLPLTKEYSYEFIFLTLLLNRNEIISFGMGAAQQNVSQDELKKYKIIKPTADLALRFKNLINPMFEQIETLQQQNTQLRQIRDRLLPRLISGKLEVK